jgi:hypothetical protein
MTVLSTSLPRSIGLLTRCYSTGGRPLIARYRTHLPFPLARVQSGDNVRLRDYETQVKLKRFSYDLKLRDGKVWPAEGENFIGMSNGLFILSLLTFQRSEWLFAERTTVTYVPGGRSQFPRQ